MQLHCTLQLHASLDPLEDLHDIGQLLSRSNIPSQRASVRIGKETYLQVQVQTEHLPRAVDILVEKHYLD